MKNIDANRFKLSPRGVMLALVFVTPFLGWGFLLHAGLASGFGAFLLAKPWRSASPVAAPAIAPALS